MQPITWIFKKFDDLTPHELYALLQLRQKVFTIEQQVIYLDLDDRDQQSMHLLAFSDDALAAYARILPPGLLYNEPSVGRVVNAYLYRGKGIGKALMQEAIKQTELLYGNTSIKISAQYYLKKFYGELGFETVGEPYMEDNILHIAMIKK